MRFVSVYYHPFLCCLVGIACRRVTGAQITAPFIIICVSSSRFCIRFVRGLRRVRYLFLALYVILFLWLISFVLLSFFFHFDISLLNCRNSHFGRMECSRLRDQRLAWIQEPSRRATSIHSGAGYHHTRPISAEDDGGSNSDAAIGSTSFCRLVIGRS